MCECGNDLSKIRFCDQCGECVDCPDCFAEVTKFSKGSTCYCEYHD